MVSSTERQTTSTEFVMTGTGLTLHRPEVALPPGSTVVTLGSALDFAAAPPLRERLVSELRPGIRLLALDLSRVLLCDQAGLAVLIGTQHRASLRGIVVCLVAPSLPVTEELRSTGLDRHFTIYPDLPGALSAGANADPRILGGLGQAA